MNDFTRDELEIILLDMACHAEKSPALKESPIHFELRNKIRTMIDNYCEHKTSGQVSDVDYVTICTKCKELTGWM